LSLPAGRRREPPWRTPRSRRSRSAPATPAQSHRRGERAWPALAAAYELVARPAHDGHRARSPAAPGAGRVPHLAQPVFRRALRRGPGALTFSDGYRHFLRYRPRPFRPSHLAAEGKTALPAVYHLRGKALGGQAGWEGRLALRPQPGGGGAWCWGEMSDKLLRGLADTLGDATDPGLAGRSLRTLRPDDHGGIPQGPGGPPPAPVELLGQEACGSASGGRGSPPSTASSLICRLYRNPEARVIPGGMDQFAERLCQGAAGPDLLWLAGAQDPPGARQGAGRLPGGGPGPGARGGPPESAPCPAR